MLNRRRFFTNTSALAAVGLGFPHIASSAESLRGRSGQRPRHIIHLVSDGMSVGTLTCADHFSHLLRGRGLTWIDLYNQRTAWTGLMNMRSLNSLVTDSSAASSSWGSGARIMNGKLNQMRDGRDLTTLYQLFGESGWKRGLVTTAEITHATPAGFAANVEKRDNADAIAAQYLDRKIDVLLGGGRKFFEAKERKDKRNLLNEFRLAGYAVALNSSELHAASTDQRWLGVFDSSHLPFTLDHRQNVKKRDAIPTLAAMTTRALEWLGRRSHFILQVEGARIDHACHNSDAAAALYDQIAFDEAIDVCLEFQRQEPETLLIITTDHGNGNLGLNGMGDSYAKSSPLFRNLLQVKRSFPELLDLLRKSKMVKVDQFPAQEEKARLLNPNAHPAAAAEEAKTPEKKEPSDLKKPTEEKKEKEKEVLFVQPLKEIIDAVHQSTGFKINEKKAALLAPFLAKKGTALYEGMNSDTAALGQLLANHYGISFTSTAHTSDYVPLVALGPGADQFRGFIQNTEVFYKYLAFAKLDFRNPSEPELAAAQPVPESIENIEEYSLA